MVLASEVLTTAFMPAIAEELLFRGLLYRAFRLRFPTIDATLLSSLIFTLAHPYYFRFPFQLVVVFLMGSICALLMERTRSLTPSVAFHFAANATTITTSYLFQFSG